MSNLNFWSGKNYMKRDSSSGQKNMAAPVTSAYGGLLFVTQLVVTHNLGYLPFFTLSYEPFGDGILWPAMGNRFYGLAINPSNTAKSGPYLIGWPTTTTLTIELGFDANTLTGTFPVDFVIYKDYGLV